MSRCAATLMLVLGLAFLAQLWAAAWHPPVDASFGAESASVETHADHEEEVVAEVAPAVDGALVRRWRAEERSSAPTPRADEILHVPRG